MNENQKPDEAKASSNAPGFAIQATYIKDISFEAPNTPAIFNMEWKPELNWQLDINSSRLDQDRHEVVLKITVTVKVADKVAFLIEVEQAGIFILKSFPDDQLHYMLGSFCPNVLFPYAREIISDIVMRGNMPPLYLAPVNFDNLYHQRYAKEKEGTTTKQ